METPPPLTESEIREQLGAQARCLFEVREELRKQRGHEGARSEAVVELQRSHRDLDGKVTVLLNRLAIAIDDIARLQAESLERTRTIASTHSELMSLRNVVEGSAERAQAEAQPAPRCTWRLTLTQALVFILTLGKAKPELKP
jgi:chromosome segregation ATPase